MKYSLFAGVVAAFAAVAAAATPKELPFVPTGPLAGNPISHPSTSNGVTAGKEYKITWEPTTKGPISLILLRGPSENIKQVSYIATSQKNSGTYTWNVPATLEPDVTHYGIQLVDETDGSYQYSMQFGVANPEYKGDDTPEQKPKETPEDKPSTYPAPTKSKPEPTPPAVYPSAVVTPSPSPYVPVSSKAWNTTMSTYPSAAGTGSGAGSATAAPTPFTGAAGKVTVGGGLMAVAAVVVAFL